jgi:hypothetical protein
MKREENITEDKRGVLSTIYHACHTLSRRAKRQLLAMTGIGIVCICILAIVEPKKNIDIVPSGYTVLHLENSGDETLLSGSEYKMLLDFIHTMDSLRTHDRATYDAILQGHEGLLDSVHFVIGLYRETLH